MELIQAKTQVAFILFSTFSSEEKVQRMKDFLKRKEKIAAHIRVSDRICDFYGVVFREITDNFYNSFEFFLDDRNISVGKDLKQRCVLGTSIEIVKSIQVCSQMPNDNPTSAGLLQYTQ